MSVKIAKVTRKIAPDQLPYIDAIVANMISQAKDRAQQEGGVLTPQTTVKIVVEQEFLNGN